MFTVLRYRYSAVAHILTHSVNLAFGSKPALCLNNKIQSTGKKFNLVSAGTEPEVLKNDKQCFFHTNTIKKSQTNAKL